MPFSLIVNITTGHYVSYNGNDEQAQEIMQELLTPSTVNSKYSFWKKTDKIVYCPKNLETFVIKNYGEIFVFKP